MLKVIKYLKPYIALLFLCLVLLFAMVNMELALPDYMSRIVNVGVQQGGIENVTPKAIRGSVMENILFLADDEETVLINNSYQLYKTDKNNTAKLKEEYPALEKEDIYLLKDNTESIELETVLTKICSSLSMIQRMSNNPEAMKKMPKMENTAPGNDFFTMLKTVPEEQKATIISSLTKQITAIDDMLKKQMAIQFIQQEYEAIGIDMEKLQLDYIKKTGLIMVLFTLGSIMLNIIIGFLAARIAAGSAKTLRGDVFKKVQSFNGEEFDRFSTASLITRTTNDITQIQMVIYMVIRMVFYAPIMGAGGVVRAVGKAPSMAWLIGLVVIILLGLIALIFSIASPKFKIMQSLVDKLNLVTREQLSGLMVVRAFNRQKFEERRFDNANKDLTSVNLFIARTMAAVMPLMMLLMNGLSVAIVWIGAKKINASEMQVGDMMAFIQYAMQIVMSFLMLSMVFIFLPRASVSGQRVSEVLKTKLSIVDPDNPKSLDNSNNIKIEFKNVSFKYPGGEAYALSDISFTAEPGKTTAIIGSTGSGKTSIANLIPRFYDASEGEVLLNGINVKDLSQKELRANIGYVPQKINLFKGSIRSNIQYGKESSSEREIFEAAETAQLMELINLKEKGLDSEIAQGGQNVSGGQKQRIAIARALIKKAAINIFDDSFSALDFKTDSALRKALKAKAKDSTLIIVAQRVSTIMQAEQIIVMDNGSIVGKGKHDYLMKNCEEYRQIVHSQLSMEEL